MAKLDLNRQPMPSQDPLERSKNFNEVALGYREEQALAEASRCLRCKNHPCMEGCPVNVDIPEFVGALKDGNMAEAVSILKRKNNLPAICGRVCPQETQCESLCLLGKKGAPIAIGRLERFVADWALSHTNSNGARVDPDSMPLPGAGKVAIIGAGPAGLTAAGDLARMGHKVTIFEALHLPGGVLTYGIPEFRLPKAIVQAEVEYVKSLGVEILCDVVAGKAITVDELMNEWGFDAVFLGTGAGLPSFMGIPGENCNGVYSANEFLTRSNLMKAYLFPQYDTPIIRGKRVAVVGGGNVAMDAVRTAKRLGAELAAIVYRRSRSEMPARHEEVEHAEEEGIEFYLLTNPTRILADEKNWVKGLECIKMELGEPDASGRRSPVPIKGSEFVLDVDTVIMAIGTSPNPLVPRSTPGLEVSRRGTVVADPQTGKTTKEGVYAGGDVVTGAATVIEAMGAGKRAAAAIDEYVRAKVAARN
ncbi:MAG: NADPH-dependent glutamate synthase [Chloroflexota bacterium]|jgi:glutamate synthase (NADPH/NADH) small chain